MATDAEKQELFETLKFTPRTYRIELWGYGGEHVMGLVHRDVYNYFKDNNISIEEFATDGDYGDKVPMDFWPFTPGEWYECNNVCHETSVLLDKMCGVTVLDENNEEVWRSDLDYHNLSQQGISIEGQFEYYANDYDDGTCVYIGISSEKGMFFEGELHLKSPFNPEKLTFYFTDFEDYSLVTGLDYDGEHIECDNIDTTGKGMEHHLICVGEES